MQRPRPGFVIAANGPRGMRLAARQGAGWATTARPADSQAAWWSGVAELSERMDEALVDADRDRRSIDRYLNLDAAPVSPLSSVDAFTDAVGQADALGFTDAIVRWPRPQPPTRAAKPSSSAWPRTSCRPSAQLRQPHE